MGANNGKQYGSEGESGVKEGCCGSNGVAPVQRDGVRARDFAERGPHRGVSGPGAPPTRAGETIAGNQDTAFGR